MAISEADELKVDEPARQKTFDEEVHRNFRWNFLVNILYGLFGTTGWRLIFAPTFVPNYMFELGGSNLIVGLLLSMGGASRFFTPPLIASLVGHQRYIKRKAVLIGMLMRSQVLLMALAAFFLPTRPNIILFFVFYSLFNMFLGMQNVVYNTVMAKVIPVERRGRFIGLREFLGGVTASAVALVAGKLLQTFVFPKSYGATYLLAFVLTFAGLIFFSFTKEPAAPATLKKISLRESLRSIPPLMRKDRNFANYCICRAIGSLALMANPFFILYARTHMPIEGKQIGEVTFCYFIALTVVNLFMGRIADRSGFRRVFIICVIIWTLAIATLLVVSPSYPLAIIVFLALGAGVGGFNMSMSNMVLEFGETSELPMRLAVVNSIGEMATSVGPLFAGFLADNVSYRAVFAIAIVCTTAALLVMQFRVSEPRFAGAQAVVE